MSQEEVFKILKKNKFMKANEISKKVGNSIESCRANLKSLFKTGLVLRREYKGLKSRGYEWCKK